MPSVCHRTAYIKRPPNKEIEDVRDLCVHIWLKDKAEGDTSDAVKPSQFNNITTLITEHYVSNISQSESAKQQYTRSNMAVPMSISGLQCVFTQELGSYLSYKRRIRPQNRSWPTWRSVSHNEPIDPTQRAEKKCTTPLRKAGEVFKWNRIP